MLDSLHASEPAGPAQGATRPELLRALARVVDPSAGTDATCAILGLPGRPDRASHTALFVLETHPHASVHLGPEGMIGGDAADRVSGFWRTLGMEPPSSADELCTLLELSARLSEAELAAGGRRRAAIASARSALLWEHIVCWAPVHLASVSRVGQPFYRAWADLLIEALAAEVDALPPRRELPTSLSASPAPLDLASRQSLLASILAPARAGMVLTRADLIRASQELGVGVRIGDRRFMLESLLDQEPAATLAWLGCLAEEWVFIHRSAHPSSLMPIGVWWSERAAYNAALLAGATLRAGSAGQNRAASCQGRGESANGAQPPVCCVQ